MSKSRKTVSVAKVLAGVNAYLASDSPHITPEMRHGASVVLHSVLHDSGNYEGFGYQTIPGKQYFDAQTHEWVMSDESRRFYYVAPGLKTGLDTHSPI